MSETQEIRTTIKIKLSSHSKVMVDFYYEVPTQEISMIVRMIFTKSGIKIGGMKEIWELKGAVAMLQKVRVALSMKDDA